MDFTGFEAEDFDLFAIPEFSARMGEIRARLRPKLVALGADLTPQVEELLGLPTFPHAAQHMRRRVNPPVETWVAYGRDKKGYKRWTHYRIAVSGAGVRVTVFVEDDADDKAQLGANLEGASAELLDALGANLPLQWYTLNADRPVPQAEITPEALQKAGQSLQRFKTVKFQAGLPLPRAEALRLGPEQFESWALEQITLLKPLYLAGAQPEYRP